MSDLFTKLVAKSKLWTKVKHMKLKNERARHGCAYVPTELEHIANIITHGLWIPAALYAGITLLFRSQSNSERLVALIYSFSLLMLFTVSTCFHCVFYCDRNKCLKEVLHRADRAMIYIFIAGSYVPWLNLGHSSHPGFITILNWFIWILAAFGIMYQQIYHEKYKMLETSLYLIMSIGPMLAIIFCDTWVTDLDMTCDTDFMWKSELKFGGILYLVGIFFFKADGKIPFAHAIWHIFVVLAAFLHYFAILNHLFPTKV